MWRRLRCGWLWSTCGDQVLKKAIGALTRPYQISIVIDTLKYPELMLLTICASMIYDMGAKIEPLPLTQPALGRGRSLEESRAANREKPP